MGDEAHWQPVGDPVPEGWSLGVLDGKGNIWVAPPGTAPVPEPSPVTPYILLLHGRHQIEGTFTPPTGLPLKLVPVAYGPDWCSMWALSPNNPECFVKVVKSDAGWAPGVTAITNVQYRVTVTDQQTGKVEVFENAQGHMQGDLRWNAFPA
jgi:hypothetical protein